MTDPIRFLARSKSGSEHIIKGKVKDRQGVPFASVKEGRAHLSSNEWTDIRVAVNRSWDESEEAWRIVWDDQKVTFNKADSSIFWYEQTYDNTVPKGKM